MLSERYGPWAVIAGGSKGVGASFACELAKAGINLVLVARSGDKLKALSSEVSRTTDAEVRT